MKLDIKSLSNILRLEYFILFLTGIALFGLVIIFVYTLVQPSNNSGEKVSTFGMFIFIAIATFLSGLLIGFIFGVPRTTESQNAGPKTEVEKVEQQSVQKTEYKPVARTLYIENSNLERISDWLTTGIVAIALTNLNNIPQNLMKFSWYIGQALNNSTGVLGNYAQNSGSSGTTAAGVLGSLILIGYSIDGFLISYLGTRRRAAVDFGKGLYEEEKIGDDITKRKGEATGEGKKRSMTK
jgi:hypothetical protein